MSSISTLTLTLLAALCFGSQGMAVDQPNKIEQGQNKWDRGQAYKDWIRHEETLMKQDPQVPPKKPAREVLP